MNLLFESIADGLAAHTYAVVDQFLTAPEVADILSQNSFDPAIGRFKKAGVGSRQQLQVNETIRGDYIQWLDNAAAPAPVKIYLNRLHDLRVFLNRSLFLSLKDIEVHETVYPPGTFYRRHLDQFKKNDHRKLSVICYLNEDWGPEMGGQLRMYTTPGLVDILPVSGRLVCLRSDIIEHEVLPATRNRISLTGWMLDEVIT
jgi:SM-20-related protein